METIDFDRLARKYTRRGFLKVLGLGAGAGIASGLGTNYGLNKIGDFSFGVAEAAEREIRSLVQDVKDLSGGLQREIQVEIDRLKETYTSGKLNILVELGYADPAELAELETVYENMQAFQDHYGGRERLRIFKDRIDKRLMTIDNIVEESMPGPVQGINDAIRDLFGKPSGEAGKTQREAIRERIGALARIYETNGDNLVAEKIVLKNINDLLERTDLTPKERIVYEQLRREYLKEGDKSHLRDFILHYDSNENMFLEKTSLEGLKNTFA